MNHSVLFLAIDSPIALKCAQQMAADGDHVYFVTPNGKIDGSTDGIEVVPADVYEPIAAEKIAKGVFDREGRIDILIYAASGTLEGKKEATEELLDRVEYNVNCCRNFVEGAIPYMKQGGLQRIAMLSDRAGSITMCREPAEDPVDPLTQAGLHMLLRVYFNQLRKLGFTFRCYTSEADDEQKLYLTPSRYVNMKFSYDPDSPSIRNEEDRLVMRNPEFREISW